MSKEPKSKKFLDAKGYAILGLIIMQSAGYVIDYFTETVSIGAETQVNTKIDSRIEAAIDDANMWHKLAASPHFLKEVYKYKSQIADEMIKADSSKIDFVSYIGSGSGIRNEDILPMFVELMVSIDNGDLIFKEDIEAIISEEVKEQVKKEVKRATTRIVTARIP